MREAAAKAAVAPELLILLARMERERNRSGAAWCRKYGIGAYRDLMELPLISPAPYEASVQDAGLLSEWTTTQTVAASVLAGACRSCLLVSCDLAGKSSGTARRDSA